MCLARTRHLPFLPLLAVAFSSPARASDSLAPKTAERLAANLETRILCLGDSTTGIYYHTGGRRAYPEVLALVLRHTFRAAHLTVVNAGLSGATTRDAVSGLQRYLDPAPPHLAIIMFGLNDMNGVPIEEFQQNLKGLIERCRGVDAEVLLCTPNGVEETASRPIARLERFVDAIHSVGIEQRVPVVDIYAAFTTRRREDPKAFSLLLSDPIHPNMDGHKLTAAILAAGISGKPAALVAIPPLLVLRRTSRLISEGVPIKVLAMPPYDVILPAIFRRLQPKSQLQMVTWQVEGKGIDQIEEDAKKIRSMRPDLVVIGLPFQGPPVAAPGFARSYGSILNWSLSYARQEWDVLALPPSILQPTMTPAQKSEDELIAKLIRAQDLDTARRQATDERNASDLLAEWFHRQFEAVAGCREARKG